MGFFKKIKDALFSETSKREEKLLEKVKEGTDYSHVNQEQEIFCNGCGQSIEGTPRIFNHQGRRMMFHKRCFKKMKQGQLPTPLDAPQKEEKSDNGEIKQDGEESSSKEY